MKEKALMDMDMLFDKFPNEIYPFDFETYFASEMECELVVTNCITGAAASSRPALKLPLQGRL